MKYRVQNISEKVYSFEGVVLQPGEVSGELMLDTYQKLLALNYGTTLMPVEDEGVLTGDPAATQEAIIEEMADVPLETVVIEPVVETVSVTETVEVPAATVVAEPVVEAPKKRGRPRKNL